MNAYVILRTCERTEFETLLFDADEVIEYLNKNQSCGITFEVKTYEVPIDKDNFVIVDKKPTDQGQIIHPYTPYTYRDGICKTWEDCTNPCMDCINCPVRDAGSHTITTITGRTRNDITQFPIDEKYRHLTENVLSDSIKVTNSDNTDDLAYMPNKH